MNKWVNKWSTKDYPLSVLETDFYGHDNWYWIAYPDFGYSTIKRVFPSTDNEPYRIHSFSVAYCVITNASFWPIEAFESFMKEVKKEKLDIETVFTGVRPPLTEYSLDEMIKKGYSYNDILKELDKKIYPIRFRRWAFGGGDANISEAGFGPVYARFERYLDPPKEIRVLAAKRKMREAFEELGVEAFADVIKEITVNES